MKLRKKTAFILLSLFILQFGFISNAQTTLWEQTAGGDGIFNQGVGISTDGTGNCYVAGVMDRLVNFSTSVTFTCRQQDIFIAKYNAAGVLQWAKQAGSTKDDYIKAMCTDGSGNSFIVGNCENTAQFDGLTNPTGAFLAKYDLNGTCLWVKQTGSSFGNEKICLDGNGNIYVLNYSSITKYDPNGNIVYSFPSIGYTALCYANGYIYTTGAFSNTLTIGTKTLTSIGGTDVFFSKYDTSGNPIWAVSGGGMLADAGGKDIKVDASGNCYALGEFYNSATFGSVSFFLSALSCPFLLKIDASGNILSGWQGNAGSTLLIDALGNWQVTPEIKCFDKDYNSLITGYVNACSWASDPLTSCVVVRKKAATTDITQLRDRGITISPNPVNNILQINGALGRAVIQIVDVFGKKIKTIEITQNKTMLNVGDLIPGIYYFNIALINGDIVSRKFVKL
ncbi:MAG: T9SS type A sorting domain-containing protein [Bacteroidetes bacterium]|nr:T9SS type A sorting domain-containing protein [Bacteroidota bacterium]